MSSLPSLRRKAETTRRVTSRREGKNQSVSCLSVVHVNTNTVDGKASNEKQQNEDEFINNNIDADGDHVTDVFECKLSNPPRGPFTNEDVNLEDDEDDRWSFLLEEARLEDYITGLSRRRQSIFTQTPMPVTKKSRGEQKEAKTGGKLNRSRRSSEEKNFGDFQARGDAPKERV